MSELKDLLRVAPGLDRAVEAEYDGMVLKMQGAFDGESAAAATVLADNYLSELGALLSLGDVTGWASSGDQACIYVIHHPQTFITVLGPANKAPGRTLERLCNA